jgi:hypothetical protein
MVLLSPLNALVPCPVKLSPRALDKPRQTCQKLTSASSMEQATTKGRTCTVKNAKMPELTAKPYLRRNGQASQAPLAPLYAVAWIGLWGRPVNVSLAGLVRQWLQEYRDAKTWTDGARSGWVCPTISRR